MAANKIIRTATVAMSLNILLKGQLRYLNQFFEVIAVSGADTHLDEVAKREGVRCVPISMERKISPFKDLISLFRLYFLFKKEKPEIVHSITPKAGLLTMVAAKYAGVPIRMHTFTGLIFPTRKGLMQKLLIFMDQMLCAHATHIYPEGNGVKNDLIRYKITNKPLTVIANGNINGVDLDYFNPSLSNFSKQQDLQNELGINQNDFVFIFVGRLVKDKGINELVAAFNSIKNDSSCSVEGKNLKLLLVGPYEYELDPLLLETIKIIETNSNIITVGFQSDVRPYFAISHVLVFPSYREGFPNVVLQAGAMGLPAIVTDISGCNEIIQHDKNGLIIPVKDSDAIFAAMLLIQKQYKYNELKVNVREMIENRFNQELVWSELLKVYNAIR